MGAIYSHTRDQSSNLFSPVTYILKFITNNICI